MNGVGLHVANLCHMTVGGGMSNLKPTRENAALPFGAPVVDCV